MHHWRQFLAKVSTLFRRGRVEDEIARDVDSQLGLLEDDLQRRGVPADEARLSARRAYGGLASYDHGTAARRFDRTGPAADGTLRAVWCSRCGAGAGRHLRTDFLFGGAEDSGSGSG